MTGKEEEKKIPKIICIDDEPQVLESLNRLLRSEFEVLISSSAEEGLKLLHENKDTAIILSDYKMPVMTGIELLKEAKKISPNTVRAILSGQIHISEMSEAINSAEIHRFFLKPWENEYLRIQMLESALYHQTLVERNNLEILAITDPVTQLTNHRYFQEKFLEELKIAKKNKKQLSLIMVDVDHFKSFNDHYGHPEGDRLLAAVSTRLNKLCPDGASASRYGGEEFALVLPNTDLNSAALLAESVRESIEKLPFTGPYGRPAFVTISLGVSNFPDHYSETPALIEAADKALYQAKRQGRNQYVIATKL